MIVLCDVLGCSYNDAGMCSQETGVRLIHGCCDKVMMFSPNVITVVAEQSAEESMLKEEE